MTQVQQQASTGTVIATEEIERRWIVSSDNLPSLSGIIGIEMRQGYLAIEKEGNEVRIRQEDDKFFLTVKTDGGLIRGETPPVEISKESFDNLWPATNGRMTEKTRFPIPNGENVIELNIFKGKLTGLYMVEVEFASEAASAEFSPPAWFGEEVTEDKRYKNKNLAVHGLPQ